VYASDCFRDECGFRRPSARAAACLSDRPTCPNAVTGVVFRLSHNQFSVEVGSDRKAKPA
jgi:hypothetical protein